MRKNPPAFRHIASLTVLAGVGMAGLLTPWAWAQITAVALVVAIVLLVAARNALRRASRQIEDILEDELGSDAEDAAEPPGERLAG
jgi:membrane protein implicated in regulation of membrane protease activity